MIKRHRRYGLVKTRERDEARKGKLCYAVWWWCVGLGAGESLEGGSSRRMSTSTAVGAAGKSTVAVNGEWME